MQSERIRKLMEGRAAAYTAARSILDGVADPTKPLEADAQSRYDAHMDEYDRASASIKAEERSLAAAAELRSPINEPIRQDPDPIGADATPEQARAAQRRTKEYSAAFRSYLATGVASRALQMDSDASGGFAVAPQTFVDNLIKFADNMLFIRQRATKVRVPDAASLGVPTLATDIADADWTTELAIGGEDSSLAFGKREFRPQPLAKLLKVSNKLIRASGRMVTVDSDDNADSGAGIDGLVNDRLSYKFGVAQEKGFLIGTGALQPLGVFTASADGIDTGRDVACASQTVIAGDDLVNVKYSLKVQYWDKAAWAFHRDAVKQVRKLKDSNGQYIWAPGGIGQASLTQGQPDTILDLPFFMSEYVPNTFTTGLYTGILGDFSYYWIADALDMTVQRLVELYAATNQTGFIGRMEVDGMPVLAEAFARVKMA